MLNKHSLSLPNELSDKALMRFNLEEAFRAMADEWAENVKRGSRVTPSNLGLLTVGIRTPSTLTFNWALTCCLSIGPSKSMCVISTARANFKNCCVKSALLLFKK